MLPKTPVFVNNNAKFGKLDLWRLRESLVPSSVYGNALLGSARNPKGQRDAKDFVCVPATAG